MTNLLTTRLYNLNINSFYKSSFFFFFSFVIQQNFYSILKQENIKISYYNMYAYTEIIDVSLLTNVNKVYILYNFAKYEVFSLSKILFNFFFIKQNIDVNFNTSLGYRSILYSYHYYHNNLKHYYLLHYSFFKKNNLFFILYLKRNYLFLNKYNKFNYLINYLVKKYYFFFIFNNRFFYI